MHPQPDEAHKRHAQLGNNRRRHGRGNQGHGLRQWRHREVREPWSDEHGEQPNADHGHHPNGSRWRPRGHHGCEYRCQRLHSHWIRLLPIPWPPARDHRRFAHLRARVRWDVDLDHRYRLRGRSFGHRWWSCRHGSEFRQFDAAHGDHPGRNGGSAACCGDQPGRTVHKRHRRVHLRRRPHHYWRESRCRTACREPHGNDHRNRIVSGAGLSASVGGTAVATTYDTPTQLTATFPGGTAGAKTVGVINPDGQSFLLPSGYTYVAAPIVSTSPATDISFTTATLNGSVNGSGEATSTAFERCSDAAMTSGCVTSTAAPPSTTSATPIPVSLVVNGLTPATTYHFRAIADNAGGPGADRFRSRQPRLRDRAHRRG